ncbi:MAG: hypothetical protein PHG03_01700 [Bacilli bacterium]|nr:hypothetical protein [Bacilli bacterium]MDD4795259.1 hypothetical protein [Bacilli bacterium]
MENQTNNIEEVLNQETILILELDLILPCIPSRLKANLTEAKVEKLVDIYHKGLICLGWNDNNVQEVCFTLTGKYEVFKVKYADEILCFKEHLKMRGYSYNSKELDGFLLNQDLSRPVEELLTFNNFDEYWAAYGQYFESKR